MRLPATRGVVWSALALLGAGRFAIADLPYATSFEKAVEAAKAKQRLVVVVVVANVRDHRGRNPCQMLRERTLGETTVRKLVAERFVPFLLDLDNVKAGRQPMPKDLEPLFKPGALIRLPMVLVYAPGGGVVAKLLGYLPPGDFAKKLKAVPEKLARASRQGAAKGQGRPAGASEGEELEPAMEALEAALGGKPSSAAAARERQAQAALQQGLELEKEGKTAEAIATYRKLIKEFPATRSATEARKRLSKLLPNRPRQ